MQLQQAPKATRLSSLVYAKLNEWHEGLSEELSKQTDATLNALAEKVSTESNLNGDQKAQLTATRIRNYLQKRNAKAQPPKAKGNKRKKLEGDFTLQMPSGEALSQLFKGLLEDTNRWGAGYAEGSHHHLSRSVLFALADYEEQRFAVDYFCSEVSGALHSSFLKAVNAWKGKTGAALVLLDFEINSKAWFSSEQARMAWQSTLVLCGEEDVGNDQSFSHRFLFAQLFGLCKTEFLKSLRKGARRELAVPSSYKDPTTSEERLKIFHVAGVLLRKVLKNNTFSEGEGKQMLKVLAHEKDSAGAISAYTKSVDRGALLYPTPAFNAFVLSIEIRVAFFLTSQNYVEFQDRLIPFMQEALLGDKALRDLFDAAISAGESPPAAAAAASAASSAAPSPLNEGLADRLFQFMTLRYARIRHLYTLRDLLQREEGKGKVGWQKATREKAKPKLKAKKKKEDGEVESKDD